MIGEELRRHFSAPYFIPPQPPEANTICWIFMGLPGQGAFMHVSIGPGVWYCIVCSYRDKHCAFNDRSACTMSSTVLHMSTCTKQIGLYRASVVLLLPS